MALTSASEPRGLAALRHLLVDDEGGSAAVEFIVLIPVYIVLLAGLFTMSQVMHVRQQVVAAARFEAWNLDANRGTEHGPDAIRDAFFGVRSGTWSCEPRSEDLPLELAGAGRGRDLGNLVLANKVEGANEQAKPPLRRVLVDGIFEWTGLSFLTGARIAISTRSAVVLMTDHKRPMFQDGMQSEHPMVGATALNNLRQRRDAFDPAGDSNPYLSPVFGTFRDGGSDPGIWSREARLGGNVMSEHGIYRQKMGQ
ncbi:MAG: pilus assembly protein [Planctomycetes bacterium]|nr:pilus assembly protein [Planctomycetota bacterium]